MNRGSLVAPPYAFLVCQSFVHTVWSVANCKSHRYKITKLHVPRLSPTDMVYMAAFTAEAPTLFLPLCALKALPVSPFV